MDKFREMAKLGLLTIRNEENGFQDPNIVHTTGTKWRQIRGTKKFGAVFFKVICKYLLYLDLKIFTVLLTKTLGILLEDFPSQL